MGLLQKTPANSRSQHMIGLLLDDFPAPSAKLIAPALAPGLDGESVPPGEAQALQSILNHIAASVRANARHGAARRDAHPKAHGVVRASFRVLDNLPDELRAGLFVLARAYPCYIRFSNGFDTPRTDRLGDARGMAIKLAGATGSRSGTQDFLLINSPALFVRNAVDYVDFFAADPRRRFFLPGWNPLKFRWHELFVALAIARQKTANPLNTRYWSTTPFLFGTRACKFSARPAGPASLFVERQAPDFLHDNLAQHLASQGAEFDFMVQLRGNPAAMPLEDAAVEWSERAAPFIPVARILIPPQDFDHAAQRTFGEDLSFSPWHGLDAHRPLGGINRVRRGVYEAVSRLRHELNGAERKEPEGF